jgi:hypothetical protein
VSGQLGGVRRTEVEPSETLPIFLFEHSADRTVERNVPLVQDCHRIGNLGDEIDIVLS